MGEPDAVGRALGAFYGLAIGDALGMPTQMLPRAVVTDLFGELPWFAPGPEVNEISAGLPAGGSPTTPTKRSSSPAP